MSYNQAEMLSIIRKAISETAIEVNEVYRRHGTLIGRSDIIREIGQTLYDAGVKNGKLRPKRKLEGVKGKLWFQTQEYVRYKTELSN